MPDDRTASGVWVLKRDLRGEPGSSPMAWWFDAVGTEMLAVDEVLFGEDGKLCGKGGCGAQFYTHVRLAAPGEIPPPPQLSELERLEAYLQDEERSGG